MLEYRRYRDAGAHLAELFAAERPHLYRSAPLPPELRRVSLDAARPVIRPRPARRGDRRPAARPAAARRQPHPPDGLARAPAAASCATCSAAAARSTSTRAFGDRGPPHPGGDPVRAAGDAQARRGDVEPARALRPDRDRGGRPVSDGSSARTVEALLFLSPEPVSAAELAEACEASEAQIEQALELLAEDLAPGRRGVVLERSRAASRSPPIPSPRTRRGGCCEAAHAAADPGPGRDAGDRRLPAAGLAAGDRADPRRLLGVGGRRR